MTPSIVFVSGANGYISQHICKDLLAAGHIVVGSVRSAEKGDNLKKLLQSKKFTYEVVPDIVPKGAFDEALKKNPQIEYFLHTASPFTFDVTDIEKELLTPAIEGTKNALQAIMKFGKNVKHVVVTSSYAAMSDSDQHKDPTYIANEDSWCGLTYETAQKDTISGYIGSKKLAELAARDFVKNNKVLFTLNTVNPVYVFGPQAFDEEVKDKLNTSAEVVNTILNLKSSDDVPEISAAFCDVRDVSKAHLLAFSKPDTYDARLLISECSFAAQDILDILNQHYKQLKGKLPVGKPGSKPAELWKIDNSNTRRLLGFEFIQLKQSVVDSVDQLFRARK